MRVEGGGGQPHQINGAGTGARSDPCQRIAPGYFSTEINAGYLDTEPGKKMVARVPMRRFGNLPDLDGPLLLLASDAGRFMTGSVITVDGGQLLVGV